ncbi:hypothetical protein C2G38_621497 [Gigaspora rosea]|uniref:Uncharacterized protein n=1 Tax=Gigaspora rosea TaxID=44941 RepID=A0A397U4P3_9GLOM|nr:hypothetical protein C2G38_621497 [Gigaspora rosea]
MQIRYVTVKFFEKTYAILSKQNVLISVFFYFFPILTFCGFMFRWYLKTAPGMVIRKVNWYKTVGTSYNCLVFFFFLVLFFFSLLPFSFL